MAGAHRYGSEEEGSADESHEVACWDGDEERGRQLGCEGGDDGRVEASPVRSSGAVYQTVVTRT